jgi:hypothetical protein
VGKKSNAKKSKTVSIAAFRAVAAGLTAIEDKYSNVVICPLCLKEFSEGDIEQLSRDHVIPQALGGTIVTITCRKCNNRFGTCTENDLLQPFRLAENLAGEKGVTGKLTVGQHSFSASMKMPPNLVGGMKIEVLGGPPESFSELHESLSKQRVRDWSFNHQLPYRLDRAIAAIGKAAYLAVFRLYGYCLALSPAGDAFRLALLAACDERSQLLRPLIGNLARVDRLTGGEPEFGAFAVQMEKVSFTFVVMLFRFGRGGLWMYALLPDLAGYAEGIFATQTVFDYLAGAKKLLASLHIQMRDDGEGGALYRFYNPATSYATEVVRISVIR